MSTRTLRPWTDLVRLHPDVEAGALAGHSGYNRVLKLRTPFGSGKSHTLAALLHAARHREALDGIPEARGFARPGHVAVAVFDGEKFDARNGKIVMTGWQPVIHRQAAQAGDGTPAPLIDALHRILWLVENQPRSLGRFLDAARPDRERLRLVAQALAGSALAGKRGNGPEYAVVTTASEQAALKKLVANWRALIDQRLAELPLFGRKDAR